MTRYSVWRNADDSPVCIGANAINAAKAMGCVSVDSFYSVVCKALKGINKKWTVIKEEE